MDIVSSEKETGALQGGRGDSGGTAAAVLLPVTDLSLQLSFAVPPSQEGGALRHQQEQRGTDGSRVADGEQFSPPVDLSSIPSEVRNQSSCCLFLHSNGVSLNPTAALKGVQGHSAAFMASLS